jgi:putative protein-disulfide isomerase
LRAAVARPIVCFKGHPLVEGAARMSDERTIVYGFDPMCGWCYGFIPALEHLVAARPDLRVSLAMGGLVTGERVRPYGLMKSYIANAVVQLEAVTGRRPSERFFARILDGDATASSIPPCAAILQVTARAPARALAFAHAVQTEHFRDGRDMNDPAVYPAIAANLGIAVAFDIPVPDAMPPAVAAAFDAGRALGIRSFPTILVPSGGRLISLPTEYRPNAFLAQIDAALPR